MYYSTNEQTNKKIASLLLHFGAMEEESICLDDIKVCILAIAVKIKERLYIGEKEFNYEDCSS